MASTFSTNLAIELIGTGDQSGTWGNTTNTNLGTLIEQAISGYVTQAVSTGTDTTITIPNGATGVARNMYIELTGTGGASTNLIVPANKKLYFIYNNTASGQVTVKVSGQTGISVPNGKKMVLVSNGTDIVDAVTYFSSASTGALTVTSLTDTGLTSGRVTYAGASGLLQDSANLTFNGTTLTANTIGAFILSGNITQSGNPSINIGTGALTAGATAVTTLSASGALTYGGVTLSNSVTGTGSMVLATSPTLTTPNIGAATGTSLNLSSGALTAGATGVTTLTASSGSATPALVLQDAGPSQGTVQLSSSSANYNVRGGNDYIGLEINTASGKTIWQKVGGTAITAVTSTGLAVTGALSASGDILWGSTSKGRVSHDTTNLYVDNVASGATYFRTNGTTIIGTWQASGLAVTGALSATIASGSAIVQSAIANDAVYAGTLYYANTARAASASFDMLGMYANSVAQFRVNGAGAISSNGTYTMSGTPGYAGAAVRYFGGNGNANDWYINSPTGGSLIYAINQSEALTMNSTGLAVTGTITSTYNAGANVLTIKSSTQPVLRITDDGTTSIGDFTIVSGAAILRTLTNTPLAFLVNSSEIVRLGANGLSMTTGYIEGAEQTAPAAPSSNGYRIYAEDNGAGKTRLMVKFATGAAQQIAIEP